MSYNQLAQLEVLNAMQNIQTEAELQDFRNCIAYYFATKAQKAIDALWDNGTIDSVTIQNWGQEHLRTPYRHASHRS